MCVCECFCVRPERMLVLFHRFSFPRIIFFINAVATTVNRPHYLHNRKAMATTCIMHSEHLKCILIKTNENDTCTPAHTNTFHSLKGYYDPSELKIIENLNLPEAEYPFRRGTTAKQENRKVNTLNIHQVRVNT